MRPVSQWIQLALLGICIAPLGWALELHRGSNLFHPDSPSYFVFDPSRTVGYPAFLWAVQFVTGSLSWAAPVQTVLVAFALFALGLAIYRATRRIAFAVAAQIALVSSVGIWSFSGVLMTEAVATSAVAFWCAILILNVFKPTLKAIALLIIFAGLATSIRPALVTLFAGTALFSLFVSGNRNKFAALVMTIAGFAIAWEATPASQWLVHGSVDTASPFARGILQHSLFCAPGADPKTAEGRFVESFAKPVRRYVDQAPSGAISKVRVEYSTRLRFGLIIPTLAKVHRFRWGWQVDPLLLRIADERIQSNPSCFVGSIANSYWKLATFGTGETPRDIAEIRAFFATHPQVQIQNLPTPPGEQAEVAELSRALHQPLPKRVPPGHMADLPERNGFAMILLMQVIYGFASFVGLAALVALPFAKRLPRKTVPLVAAIAALGAAYHGAMVITAVVEFGLSRYLVPLWPLAISIWAISLFGVASLARKGSVRSAKSGKFEFRNPRP